ncbi:MAG: glycosyltransferase family 4 protein [Maioricimonas sp. JB049]
MPRIVFVTTHPIQYQVPVFRDLATRPDVDLTVLFAQLPDSRMQGDGFGVAFEWDVPLLQGYHFAVLTNVARRPSVTRFSGCDTPGIGRELQRLRPDVVVVNGWVTRTCVQALRACRRLRIPCVVRGEANDLRPRPLWKRMLQAQLVRKYDACLYIGRANRAFYRRRGVPEARLFPSPYCVDNARFAESPGSLRMRHDVRRRLSIPERAVCFLFSGKFESKKHPIELLESFAVAVPSGNMHLLMVGDGALRPRCEELARQRGLPVHFAGFVNQQDMPAMYAAADCLVLPSDYGETWGLVVNEAMAAGRPAIVSDQVGCADDLIRAGETGWTYPFGNRELLSQRLVTATSEQSCLREMGAAARETVAGYSPRVAADGIHEAALALLKEGPRSSRATVCAGTLSGAVE